MPKCFNGGNGEVYRITCCHTGIVLVAFTVVGSQLGHGCHAHQTEL